MKKSKWMVDAHVFDGAFQGTRTLVLGLYQNLVKADQETQFYFVARDVKKLREIFKDSPNITFLKLKSKSKSFRLLFEFPWLIWKHKIDIAHFQYIVPPIKLCKYVVSLNDILFEDFPKEFPLTYRIKNGTLFKFSGRISDVVHTIYNYSKQRILTHYSRIKEHKVLNLPLGVPLQRPSEEELNSSRKKLRDAYQLDKFILYVSRIEPRKNHDLLFKAFLELNLWEKGYHLVFIGKSAIRNAKLDRLIEENKEISDRHFIHLEQVDQLFKDFLISCKLFVFPSKGEGFGLPPVEAASMGVDTVCANTTSLAEFDFLEDNMFDPNNLDELKAVITKCLTEVSEVKSRRIERIVNVIQERYNWEEIAVDFGQGVKDILGQRHSNSK